MADEAKDKSAKKQANPEAEAKNWDQRLRSEREAPHKWNESWGSVFNNGVPHEYDKRIKYYEDMLKKKPTEKIPPKYGIGPAFPEPGAKDYRRKKFYIDGPPETEFE